MEISTDRVKRGREVISIEGDAPPTNLNQSIVPKLIQFEPELLETGIETWQPTLIGQFIGHPLSLSMVHRNIPPLWNTPSLHKIVQFSENLFGFKFNQYSDTIDIEARSPWDINGHSLLLKRWHPGIKPRSHKINSVPTWMSILDLPSEYFTEECISRIVNEFGELVKIDEHTKNLEIVAYARVCVQMRVDKPLPLGTNILLGDGPHWVPFEFEHKSKICRECSGYGHLFEDCDGKSVSSNSESNLYDYDSYDSGDVEDNVKDIGVNIRSLT